VSGILLFRKEALDKLNAPEDLDSAVQLVTPTHWLALVALLSLVVTTTLWGLFGVTHRTLEGEGVIELAHEERLARVYVSAGGALTVRRGQAAAVRIPGMVMPVRGQVISIGAAPENGTALAEAEADNPSLQAHLREGQWVAIVVALPDAAADAATLAGYSIHCTIIGPPMRPIGLLFPSLSHVFGL
jgi:hypothetical protein